MRVLFAAGGTGGHLSPALSLARTIRDEWDGATAFLTAGRDVERHFLSPRDGGVTPLFPGSGSRPSLLRPRAWIDAVSRARRAMESFQPHAVVAAGGYVTLPVVAAALAANTPLYLLEQNAWPGRATRLARPFARRIFCHFDGAAACLGQRAVACGSPLGVALTGPLPARQEARTRFGLDPDRPTLLVAGGSLGAQGVNDVVLDNARALAGWAQVLHITGDRRGDPERVRAHYRDAGLDARVLPFCNEMVMAYRAADLIVCRAGGMTLAEICTMGLPAVMVPYPAHRDRHQYHNAEVLAQRGAGVVLEEQLATAEAFRQVVVGLLRDETRLQAMGAAARSLARPKAANRVLAILAEELGLAAAGRSERCHSKAEVPKTKGADHVF